jgi:hypothetical protein
MIEFCVDVIRPHFRRHTLAVSLFSPRNLTQGSTTQTCLFHTHVHSYLLYRPRFHFSIGKKYSVSKIKSPLKWFRLGFDSFPNDQGDQIGRILANWAIVYFGQFLNILEVAQLFCYFFHGKIRYVLKINWLGFILGHFLTNSSGHLVNGLKPFLQCLWVFFPTSEQTTNIQALGFNRQY